MGKTEKQAPAPLAEVSKPKVAGAREPRWANAERTAIDLVVTFEGPMAVLGEVPFTASPDDPEEHGRELFLQAQAGDFGPIKPATGAYIKATIEAELEQRLQEATTNIQRAEARIAALEDVGALGLLTEAAGKRHDYANLELKAWRQYRASLMLVPDVAGYPSHVNWPTEPTQGH